MDVTEQADTVGSTLAPPSTGRGRSGTRASAVTTTRIGRYAVLRRLGAGGMGVVFAAYDEQLDRKLAIKLLHRHGHDSRLLREAQGLARLSHPNVVQIYEVGEHEGGVFMAMEFIAGRTLGDWLEQSPRSRADIIAAFTAAGRGLAAAHAARLIHRDFKPDNVMIGDDGRIKVMDFGLVRADGELVLSAEPDASSPQDERAKDSDPLGYGASRSQWGEALTCSGIVMGTPAYMAPEQHQGHGIDARSDQFSFCVALWEALYGQRPFAGETVVSLTYSVLEGELDEPPRDADVPGWLRRVLERGLALEPEARWPSMDALLAALARDPTRRRRLWVGALAVTALAVGTWGGVELREQRAEEAARADRQTAIESCEQRGRALVAAAWNDQRARRAHAAFAASKLSFAADTWTRTASHLNAYAADLAQAQTSVCIGLEVEGTIDAHLANSTQRCLHDRLAHLDSLASLLAEADDGRIHRAAFSIASLPLVRDCSDPHSLSRQAPLPDDPEIREQVRALHVELAEIRARRGMGELDEALERAETLVERAVALGWAPMIAATTLVLGDLHDESGDYVTARAELEQAMYVAAKAGDDALALDAVVELVHTVGFDLDEAEDGLRLARLAEILVERTEAGGSLIEAKLRTNTGSVRLRSQDLERAHLDFEAALAIQEALLPPQHPTLAITLNNIGIVHGKSGDLDRALQFFVRSLAIREASYPAEHPRLAAAYFNIGGTYGKLERHHEARAAFERALEIHRLNLPPDHPDIAFALDGLASIDFATGNYAAAAERYAEVLRMLEAKLPGDHVDLGRIQTNLGLALERHGEPERAAEHFERAIEIYSANGPNAREPLFKAWQELAAAQHDLGDAEASVASYETALRVASEPGVDPSKLPLAYWHLAHILWEQVPRRRAEAIELMRACYLATAKHGEPGDNDKVVAWLQARRAEPPPLPDGHPTHEADDARLTTRPR